MPNCDFGSCRFNPYYLPNLYYFINNSKIKNSNIKKNNIFLKKILFFFILLIKNTKKNYNYIILTNYLYKKNLIKNLNLNFFIFNFKLNQFFTNIVYLKNKFFFSFKMLLKFLKIKNKKNYDLFLINFLKKKIKIVKNVFIFLKIKGIKKKYLLLSKLIKVFFLKNQKNILLN